MAAVNENLLNPMIKKRVEIAMLSRAIEDCQVTITTLPIDSPNLAINLGFISEAKITGKGENEEEITYNWILKTATLTEVVRKYAQIDRLFKKEMYVYDKIIPAFLALAEENKILEPFAVTPKLHMYFTETYQESLIMDDMREFGFCSLKPSEPCCYNHVSLTMKALGKLHALSYALREHKPEKYKKFAEYTKNRFNVTTSVELFAKHQKKCCEKVLEAFNNKDRKLVQVFQKFAEKSFEYQMQAIKMGAMGAYAVLTHGDVRLDNMLFKYEDPDRPNMPTDICLLDWQFCRLGSPAFDLSQFIFLTTDKQFRDKYYMEMIRTYYYSLSSYLTELNCDAEKILPFDILLLQLKRYSVYGLCMTIMVLHFIMNDGLKSETVKTNISDADIEASFVTSVQSLDSYKKRIRDVINDYNEYGYFEFLN